MEGFVAPLAHGAAAVIETIGIGFLLISSLYALIYGGISLVRRDPAKATYQKLRRTLGRGILLGLEFLVAADIIMTVAIKLDFKQVGVLAVVVLIRTFLSFTLEVEMTGNWPWHNKPAPET